MREQARNQASFRSAAGAGLNTARDCAGRAGAQRPPPHLPPAFLMAAKSGEKKRLPRFAGHSNLLLLVPFSQAPLTPPFPAARVPPSAANFSPGAVCAAPGTPLQLLLSPQTSPPSGVQFQPVSCQLCNFSLQPHTCVSSTQDHAQPQHPRHTPPAIASTCLALCWAFNFLLQSKKLRVTELPFK